MTRYRVDTYTYIGLTHIAMRYRVDTYTYIGLTHIAMRYRVDTYTYIGLTHIARRQTDSCFTEAFDADFTSNISAHQNSTLNVESTTNDV